MVFPAPVHHFWCTASVTSVPAKLAHGIIVDTQVIRTAPEKFIYSGIGDMVSKITALYDWIFEEKHGAGVVNDFSRDGR